MGNPSSQIAITEDQDLNRLRWRCRRGMRELDALFTRFLDSHYSAASAVEQAAFRDLLTLPDPDILGLLTASSRSEDPAIRRVVSHLLGQ